jgi:hypothetical protein
MLASSVSDAFLQKILELDEGVRFAGIVDRRAGGLVAAQSRKGLRSLLSEDEVTVSVIQSLLRMDTRRTLESKLGRVVYSSTFYENVKRATIPIDDAGNVLIVSFETRSDHDSIIRDKILPMIGCMASGAYSGNS